MADDLNSTLHIDRQEHPDAEFGTDQTAKCCNGSHFQVQIFLPPLLICRIKCGHCDLQEASANSDRIGNVE